MINTDQKNSLGKRFAYIVVSSTVTVLLLCALAIVWRIYFNDPPLSIASLDESPSYSLCPGMDYPAHSHVVISSPTLLYSYFSVMQDGKNISRTQVSNGIYLHPEAADIIQVLPWKVPDLPPGDYTRVLAYRGTDGRENSLFLTMDFSIGEFCQPIQ